jgi:glycerol-3-phosphate O-acyltransferase / dihydroxyacetone phosphate acyltransferase
MDVLNVGIHVPRIMFFLANYGLFKHPVSSWILSRLYCIPVKRRDDVEEGVERNIDATFEQCYRHLERGGILYVAPEGNSYMHRVVRDFKTGTARIALGAAARNNKQLGLTIVPVGLTYTAPNLFRNDMVLQVGKPVVVADWLPAYAIDPVAAVDALTLHLQETIRTLAIHNDNEAGDEYIKLLDTITQNDEPLSAWPYWQRSAGFTQKNLKNEALRSKASAYFDDLAQHKLLDGNVAAVGKPTFAPVDLLLLLLFPVWLLGYIFWFLPCFIPAWLARKMNLYIGYDSNIKTLAGIFTFGGWLWAAKRWIAPFLQPAWLGWLIVPVFLLLGWLTDWYMTLAGRRMPCWFKKQVPETLTLRRKEIKQHLGV